MYVYIQVSQEERSMFWEVIGSVILSKKVCMYVCPIPNGFRGFVEIVEMKEIVRTVSNTGIYCSNDKVGTVYPV